MLRLRLALLAAAFALVAACGSAGPSTGVTSAPASPAVASADPGGTGDPATDEPVDSEDPTATAEPTDEPTEEPVESADPTATDEPVDSASPSDSLEPTAATGGADACTGSSANREFYLGIAGAVDWPVLCAVLPKGWYVSQGTYRLANGGKLIIGYKGPGGATIALSEGAYCSAADGCIPSGSELGDTALGPLDGTLYQTSDGFAVIASPGENPSWLMTTKGLSRDTSVSMARSLAQVGS